MGRAPRPRTPPARAPRAPRGPEHSAAARASARAATGPRARAGRAAGARRAAAAPAPREEHPQASTRWPPAPGERETYEREYHRGTSSRPGGSAACDRAPRRAAAAAARAAVRSPTEVAVVRHRHRAPVAVGHRLHARRGDAGAGLVVLRARVLAGL